MAINLDHVTEQIQVTDGATNASLTVQSKGTGAFNVAAGSSGLNISNGGTVTALNRTGGGSGYTSFPSVAISTPTTAGGVQATASVTRMFNGGATIASGGTGYTVGDVLTVVGGTPTSVAASYTVAAVSAGVVTSVTATIRAYDALPTNPVSLTGGTGTGATLNLTWILDPGGLTITNAGSGYVEQPTVTFSGGGGSGAAAYATVGSGTTVRSLGSTMSFATPQGEIFRVSDNGASVINYLTVFAGGGGAELRTAGAATNTTMGFVNKGTGNFYFSTNNSAGNTQLNVTHTASAVNFVQVTGAATGGRPAISAQGSDANVGLAFISKGVARTAAFFNNNATSSLQFSIGLAGVTNAVNYLNVNGVPASNSPELTAEGTDTNLDIRFTPKGTGRVRFGTYTGTALSIAGYIEIKDAGGTIRRLAVVA
jgi:hypothetical protein